MSHLVTDLLFALRGWRRTPGLIAAAVLAIAIGVAANTTIFSFVAGVLLQPLPYPDPGRIVVVWQDFTKISGRLREWTSPGLFVEWQRRSGDALEAIAVVRGWGPSITGVPEPERLQGAAVSAGYFNVLGATAARGRLLGAEDDEPGAPTVVVISHGLWVRRFGANPGVVGAPLQLDGEPATIVGITAPDFEPALLDAEIWSATRIPPGAPVGLVVLRAIARLRPDVPLEVAQDRMSSMARQMLDEGIGEDGAGILLEPLREIVVGPVRVPLLALMASVGFVLAIACTNVSLLLLARATARSREMAARAALGAPRGRLVTQLLTETLLLVMLGAGTGLLATLGAMDAVIAAAPPDLPRLEDVRVNGVVLAFAAGLTVLTTLAAGLFPAIRASRADLMSLVREGAAAATGASRAHRWLVGVEVALAVVLLSGAGQVLRSLDRLQRVDLGVRPDGVVAATMALPRARYQTDEAARGFYQRVIERLAVTPDVGAAGVVSVLPLSGSDTDIGFRIEGRPLPATRAEEPVTWFRIVSDGYFQAMGIRLDAGRVFADTDREDAPCVVVINRSLAGRYWPQGGAVGARIAAMGSPCEVVGVVNDVHHNGPAAPTEPEMYFSMRQRTARGASIVVRAAASTGAAATALHTVIRSEDPALPPPTLRTLDDMLGRMLAQPRFVSLLSTALAAVALALALIGVHGLLSYGVARRSREIGIRVALGAGRRDVARLVAAGSASTVLAGAATGLAGAVAMSRAIESLLFGVEPGDPLTLAVVLALIVLAGAVATIVPMRRALAVDPNVALRVE